MKMIKIMKKKSNLTERSGLSTSSLEQGFTLLFSLLIVSVALSVGMGIFNLIYGQIILSGTGRQSQFAFYVADAGVECAFYWDLQRRAFLQSEYDVDDKIQCGGQNVDLFNPQGNRFAFNLELEDNSCAEVSVDKVGQDTVIVSQGKSASCGETTSRTLQRGLRAEY